EGTARPSGIRLLNSPRARRSPLDPTRRGRSGLDRALRMLLDLDAVRAGPLVRVKAVPAERAAAHGATQTGGHSAPSALADEQVRSLPGGPVSRGFRLL